MVYAYNPSPREAETGFLEMGVTHWLTSLTYLMSSSFREETLSPKYQKTKQNKVDKQPSSSNQSCPVASTGMSHTSTHIPHTSTHMPHICTSSHIDAHASTHVHPNKSKHAGTRAQHTHTYD